MRQEYFTARELLHRFEADEDLSRLWGSHRLENEMPPADVGEWDTLLEPAGHLIAPFVPASNPSPDPPNLTGRAHGHAGRH